MAGVITAVGVCSIAVSGTDNTPARMVLKNTAYRPDVELRNIPYEGLLNGVYISDTVTTQDISDYEEMTENKVETAVIFHALSKGFEFPGEACNSVYKAGGAVPFIKIEPWSWAGPQDQSFSPQKINAGEFDKGFELMAQGARQYGKPLMISFGHEMNGDWYPWSKDPKEYAAAFRHVVDIFRNARADNVTWVWNINIDQKDFTPYYPGDNYVDMIGIDGYSTSWTNNQNNAAALFGKTVAGVQANYSKPAFIAETAYDGNGENGGSKSGKEAFLASLPEYCKKSGLAGFIYFNTDKMERSVKREWDLDPEMSKALGKALNQAEKNMPARNNAGDLSMSDPSPTIQFSTAIPAAPANRPEFLDNFLYRENEFNGMAGSIFNGRLILNSKGNNDAGLTIVLREEINGILQFACEGNVSGGGRNGGFSILYIKAGANGDFRSDRLLKEDSVKPGTERKEFLFAIPPGTDKINFMLIGKGDINVVLFDVALCQKQ